MKVPQPREPILHQSGGVLQEEEKESILGNDPDRKRKDRWWIQFVAMVALEYMILEQWRKLTKVSI